MNFIYVDEDAINPLLKCPICLKPFINPVIARDGVRYCRLCITEKATLVNTSELNYQPSFIENLVPMEEQLIHDMLDNLLVQCPDCQQTNILRKDLPTHLRLDCPKRIVVCKASDLKCPWSAYYDQSAGHIATCTFELLRPILSERCQHEQEFEEYRKSIAEQKIEIEQLKNEIQEYKDRTEKLQKGFRTFWEIHAQQKQKCEKFQNDIQQSFTEGQNQLHQDIQQLREQYDQMNGFYQQIKDDLSKPNQLQSKEFENILQQLKEHLNQYELQVKKYQEQNLNYENQITQLQKQDPLPNDDMLHIRQMCDRHEIQIRLLARKKCVVPSKSATLINTQLEGLIETCSFNSEIDLDGKHFDNLDMEFICKIAIIDKQCRKIRLENNDITAKGVTILADTLYGNTTLEELHLSNNFISDMGAHALAQALSINNSKLTWLEIPANHITDDGVQYLAEMLKTNKTLIFLGLSFNQITDRGVQYLTNAIANHNKTLQWLHLASNKGITDVSVDYIKDMFKRNQSLQALWLNDCSLSIEAAKILKKMVESNTNFILEV